MLLFACVSFQYNDHILSFQALFKALRYEDPIIREIIAAFGALFDEHPLMQRPVKEVIWGYTDPLLNITKIIDPDWFYTDRVGYFMNVSLEILIGSYKMKYVSEMVKIIMGERTKCWSVAFSHSPQMSSEDLFPWIVKAQIVNPFPHNDTF